MPEGHTIHRLARDHQRWFAGQSVLCLSPQGRFEGEAQKISGRALRRVTAHGKHLFYHFTSRTLIHVHLGLYGKFRVHRNPAGPPRGAVRWRMTGQERTFDLNGPNRCELIDGRGYQSVIKRLGEDPLQPDADADRVWERWRRSRAAVGSILLNQAVVAGVGNVYRAEILFRLGWHPDTPANRFDRDDFDELWSLTRELLEIGVKYNRIITVPWNELPRAASRLRGSERLNVYKQNCCRGCGGSVEHWALAGRTIYACLRCQVRS